jgi:hypothetical protein
MTLDVSSDFTKKAVDAREALPDDDAKHEYTV